jgi:tetratricopeptide (TPR) repeat protein
LGAALFLLPALLFSQANDNLAADSRQARELMAAQRYAEAVPIYERLVTALPGNLGLVLNLALAEEMAGEHARSLPHFQIVLKAQPNNVPALTTYSMALLQLNRNHQAIAPLRKLLGLQPDNGNALGMLADAELADNRFADAAGDYRKLTVQNDTDPRAWYGLGKAYESLASESFDHLNKAAPQSAYVAALLADSRLDRRQFRSAFFFYREAQRTLPNLPGVPAGLAAVYRETGHADWARVEQQREKELPSPDCQGEAAACAFLSGRLFEATRTTSSPSSPAGLFWMTKAYNSLASVAFDHLSRLPESVEIHALKAQTFHDHRQPLEAANEWAAAVKLSPEDPKLRHAQAAALFDAKDYQNVIRLVPDLLNDDPKSSELQYLLGASLLRTEQAEKALPFLQHAVTEAPAFLPAQAALGLVLVALNRDEQAVPHLQAALSLDDDGSLHYTLARAARSGGRTQLADEAMKQYQQIQKQNQAINEQLAKEAEISAPPAK